MDDGRVNLALRCWSGTINPATEMDDVQRRTRRRREQVGTSQRPTQRGGQLRLHVDHQSSGELSTFEFETYIKYGREGAHVTSSISPRRTSPAKTSIAQTTMLKRERDDTTQTSTPDYFCQYLRLTVQRKVTE